MTEKYVLIRGSKIHGKGAFAKCDIPKGVKIIEYIGEKITKAESDRRAEAMPKASKRGSGAVYIFQLNQRYDIDGNVSWNPARFINHACETNCESDIIAGKIWIIATRDIKKGEELHYDYGYNLDNWQEHKCFCKKPSCLGYIVIKNQRWRVRKILENKHKKL